MVAQAFTTNYSSDAAFRNIRTAETALVEAFRLTVTVVKRISLEVDVTVNTNDVVQQALSLRLWATETRRNTVH